MKVGKCVENLNGNEIMDHYKHADMTYSVLSV